MAHPSQGAAGSGQADPAAEPYKILVIEDDKVNQLILKQILSRTGYDVTMAADGQTGIDLAMALHPALIICDWMMPQMSGLEVCRWVREQPELASTFFILLTARTATQDRVRGLDSGADDFLAKPIEPNELLARVRAGLRLYRSNQTLRQLSHSLQRQQQKMEAELAQAALYVKSLLPDDLSGPVPIVSRFLPSQQLGGDCFDYYWEDDDHLVLYLLDMSGHGLRAALPSVSVQNLLRSQSLPRANHLDPAQVLAALNRLHQMRPQNPRFFTIWYGVYHRRSRTLTYASAGHPPAIVLKSADASLRPQSLGQIGQFPIGMMADSTYENQQQVLAPGTTLYLFSDGLYEVQRADNGNFLSYDDFLQLVNHYSQSQAVDVDTLIQAVQALQQSPRFEDDCLLVQACFT